MKLQAHSVIAESNSPKQGVYHAGIDFENNAGLIIENLISNYKDIYSAALREYVSNAYDSHVEAGQTRPVEVTLPTQLGTPELVIQDWGTGMSHDMLTGTFINFYSSTKRDSSDAIGGFGIGAKSGLGLGNQILITSVKDGLKNVLSYGRENTKVVARFLAENVPTNEHDGAKIQVAVDPVESLTKYSAEKVSQILGGWSASEVVVTNNQEANERLVDKMEKSENGYFAINTTQGYQSQFGQGTIIVGKVAYSVDVSNYFSSKLVHKVKFLVPVVGASDVEVNASRESILPTAKNRDVITQKVKMLVTDIENKIRSIEHKNPREAVSFRDSFAWDYLLSKEDRERLTKYKEQKIPTTVNVSEVYTTSENKGSRSGFSVHAQNLNFYYVKDAETPCVVLPNNDDASQKKVREFIKLLLLFPDTDVLMNEKTRSFGELAQNLVHNQRLSVVVIDESHDTTFLFGPKIQYADMLVALEKLRAMDRENNKQDKSKRPTRKATYDFVQLDNGEKVRNLSLTVRSIEAGGLNRGEHTASISRVLEHLRERKNAKVFWDQNNDLKDDYVEIVYENLSRQQNVEYVFVRGTNKISQCTVDKITSGLNIEPLRDINAVRDEFYSIIRKKFSKRDIVEIILLNKYYRLLSNLQDYIKNYETTVALEPNILNAISKRKELVADISKFTNLNTINLAQGAYQGIKEALVTQSNYSVIDVIQSQYLNIARRPETLLPARKDLDMLVEIFNKQFEENVDSIMQKSEAHES